jgi:hypothetical protein
MRFFLTERGLEAVGRVLADAIPAVVVERADATCDPGGGGGEMSAWSSNHGCWETRTRRLRQWLGWNTCGYILTHIQRFTEYP